MSKFSRIYMPNIVCGRGSLSFAASLGKKRVAVLGYADTVAELAKDVFKDTDAEVRYIATVSHEPLIRDIFDNLPAVMEFKPDLILAIGGGSVMDVSKGLHLFYENPDMTFERKVLSPSPCRSWASWLSRYSCPPPAARAPKPHPQQYS